MEPTMELRWVDVSTCPEYGTVMRLQQKFVTHDGYFSCWRDVEFAGHIADVEKADEHNS